ncbi:MAG TPA: NADH-quinone oxidoreductase subunit M, partial [Propionibacteriaceae bacterium]|nr:NADH-quinone oxidoreductase subunit M [Propionibacteriaceae bacterium]
MLTILALLPLVGGLVVWFLRGTTARYVGLAVALVTFVYSVVVATVHLRGTDTSEHLVWIKAFGAYYALGLDGMGLLMVLLTTLLVPVVLLAEQRTEEGRWGGQVWTALVLILESLSLYVFMATDVLLFYIFFEATLIPMYFLIAGWGGPKRARAAVKFLLFSLAGGLVLLFSVIGLGISFANQGAPSYLIEDLVKLNVSPSTQMLLFLGFFVAFAVKAPMVPVHTWLPDAAEQATPATSTLLVGILDKIGTFGMIRFCIGLFPEASRLATPVVVVLALISILYGAIAAIGQRNMLRLVAFTSVSHFGFMVLGVFALTTQSISGTIFYMVNHGFSTAVLFLVVGYLARRRGSVEITSLGGVFQVAPVMAGMLLLGGLASLSLPGMGSFVGEFLVLAGTWSRYPVIAAVGTLGTVLAALYILIMYQRTMTGPVTEQTKEHVTSDATWLERLALAPVILALLVLGFFPKP